jgi:drug/metabolite transporter (DMT)-like permease
MLLLLLSSLLFGLSNPVGALLIGSDDTLVFAFHFLLIMTLIQLPFVIPRWQEIRALSFKGEFSLLLLAGLIGTFLYWCEFSSLQVGLPITHVTFLALTVPAWTLLWEWLRGRGSKWNINKWVIALIGSAFLIVPNSKGQFTPAYLLPIFTSLLTAAWLIYAKKAQEAGISPLVCSFFNDLFSLAGVTGFILLKGRMGLITMPEHLGNLVLYSAVIGVLPNILLYRGLRTTGVVTATAIIMMEPVLSGIFSLFLNQDRLSVNFLIGSLFIVLSNVPTVLVVSLRRAVPAVLTNLIR